MDTIVSEERICFEVVTHPVQSYYKMTLFSPEKQRLGSIRPITGAWSWTVIGRGLRADGGDILGDGVAVSAEAARDKMWGVLEDANAARFGMRPEIVPDVVRSLTFLHNHLPSDEVVDDLGPYLGFPEHNRIVIERLNIADGSPANPRELTGRRSPELRKLAGAAIDRIERLYP